MKGIYNKVASKVLNVEDDGHSPLELNKMVFNTVQHRLIRLSAASVSSITQLNSYIKDRKHCALNIDSKFQPKLASIKNWSSLQKDPIKINIVKHKFRKPFIRVPLHKTEVITEKKLKIKQLTKFEKRYESTSFPTKITIKRPPRHNTKEELECIQKVLYSFMMHKQYDESNNVMEMVCTNHFIYLL